MAENDKRMKVQAGQVRRRDDQTELVPLVDVYETEDGATMLVAELPGATEDSLDIRVEKGVVTIAAEASAGEEFGEEYGRTYTGFLGGQYFRAFALSDEVDREKIEASLADGVLTLRLPRAAAAKTHKIKIKSE